MRYNNPERRFWHSLLFRRITAGMAFIAVTQAQWILFGAIVAIVDAVVILSLVGIGFLVHRKLKPRQRNYILR
jgi:hypothetical protein